MYRYSFMKSMIVETFPVVNREKYDDSEIAIVNFPFLCNYTQLLPAYTV
jgi:hypothetical protein